jgi:mRNA interferase MazF
LTGAEETKVRPAVVIASGTYLVERPDVLIGLLTTKLARATTSTDYALVDWQAAGLRAASCFRAYVLTVHRSELTVIGHLGEQDWADKRLSRGRRPSGSRCQSSHSGLPGGIARAYTITASVSSLAVKYAQSGWWNTSALTLASGSIIMPSVSRTPISSGRSSFHIDCWSSRLGHAA